MFRKPKIFVYTSLTLLIILEVAYQMIIPFDSLILSFLGYMLICPVAFFIIITGARMNVKLFAPINAALTEDCDPEAYLAGIDGMMKTEKNKKIRFTLMLDRATGLHHLGDPQALVMLEGLIADPLVNSSPIVRLIAYNNMSEFSFCAGNYDKAREYHAKMMELYKNLYERTKQPARRTALEKLYRARIIKFKIMADNYDGLEADMRRELDDPTNRRIDRVTATYDLGLYYRHAGNAHEEHECMTYVAANGNKMFIAKKAAERVKELEAEGNV